MNTIKIENFDIGTNSFPFVVGDAGINHIDIKAIKVGLLRSPH